MSLFDTDLPIIGAPMAGGPSTLELVTATAQAGGLGFLAAGYLRPEAVQTMLAAARAAGIGHGVNVFVPSPAPMPEADFRRYAEKIAQEGADYDLDLAAARPIHDDDFWSDKIDLLVANPVNVVSFTFGFPPTAVVRALQRGGSQVAITVTSAVEAVVADEVGADVLIVQGSAAGAHSGTATPERQPAAIPLSELLSQVRQVTGKPLIAAGGLATAEHVQTVMGDGAAAAMVGTALLRTDESGADPVHKDALVDPARSSTVVTRAFTGRPARGLRNLFTDRYTEFAPTGYPEIHHLTRPLRSAAAAAGDAERLHLWAGTGHRLAVDGPAREVIEHLAGGL